MVRMSDLVRGVVRETPVPPPPAAESAATTTTTAPPRERTVVPARTRTSLGSLPAEAVRPPTAPTPEPAPVAPIPEPPPAPVGPTESAEALFGELQAFIETVHRVARAGEGLRWATLESLVDRCVRSLRESADLFWIANNPVAPAGMDYLAFHQARVCVLSLRIGAATGYDRPRLLTLGMAGALIDVGLWQLPDTALRRLDAPTGEDAALYRSHPRLSADMIRRWDPPNDRIAVIVLQHHEREQGQGFPQGLQADAIDNDAKILGLIDTYTGLTTPPTSRPRLRPHEAIREIVKSRHDAFPSSLIKALLSEISVFPPGTMVKLNTEEIGRVIAVNRHHPLRPKVEVVSDSKGHRPTAPKIIDLSEAPFLYITGPVVEPAR
jgi:HD-GYP domain-containing protein (c-di-GMP phosphodiesterase class II)